MSKLLYRILSIFKMLKTTHFNVISIKENKKNNLLEVSVKVEGKGIPEIINDPLYLLKESRGKNFFNERDFNVIIDTILENQKRVIDRKHQKKYTLVKHQFSEQLEQPIIVFRETNSGLTYVRPAKEIYYNISLIRQFSSEDSACIGNVIGSYEAEREINIRRN